MYKSINECKCARTLRSYRPSCFRTPQLFYSPPNLLPSPLPPTHQTRPEEESSERTGQRADRCVTLAENDAEHAEEVLAQLRGHLLLQSERTTASL